ncbi:NLR family CARD domain-containing protein 4-like [Antedon mediterranea]|uniref:NLR family CARD domain-containing protein 4-like n=1 Tax=Antedon mediterranea TaxID=105859 RepID=UPI003AF88FCF
MNSAFEVDIADIFAELELLQSNTQEGNQPIELKGLVERITPKCRVLISGEGGIGKTTLLRYFAYNWATKDKFEIFKGKILFLINIRDLEKGDNILDAIVKPIELEDFSLSTGLSGDDPNLIKKFLMDHDDEIVLLLDGLDELRFQNKSPLRLFKRERLENSSVVVTSRSVNIDDYIKTSNLHVEVKGFDKENVTKYIRKYFEYVQKFKLGDALVEKIHSHLAYEMCKNPMLLLSICFMWEEEQHLPTDEADLFKSFFLCILNQLNKQKNAKKILKFEKIPNDYLTPMLLLGKCMYQRLKNNQLSFKESEINSLAIRDEVDDKLALQLGFVYEDTTLLKKSDLAKTFTAPHKLIVESLVGFYLYKLCEIDGLQNESKNMLLSSLSDEEWENIRESEHLKMAREFAIGFLGVNAAKLLKHWITNSFPTYRSLILLFKEVVNDEHVKEVETNLMKYITTTKLDIQINDVCNSLRIFLIHHRLNKNVHTENVLYLMRKVHDISPEEIAGNLFYSDMTSEAKGKVHAHSLIAVSDQEWILNWIPGDCMDYVVDECEKYNMKYDINKLCICHKTTAAYLVHILTNSPDLTEFYASHNTITGIIFNDVGLGLQCYSKSVLSGEVIHATNMQPIMLTLNTINISDNNLSQIDGALLASLICMIPDISGTRFGVHQLCMNNCNLSGEIMNNMIIECSSRKATLRLSKLDITDNNLSQIDGALLASLICMNKDRSGRPGLPELNMHNCNLSGEVMNNMITECSSRKATLRLSILDISDNNLSQIDGALLASLICMNKDRSGMFGFLLLNMHNCNLSGEVMNNMITVCSSRRVTLRLYVLYISDNNISQIDGALLAYLICEVMNNMITECSSRTATFRLSKLDISDNNLSQIDGALLASLICEILNNMIIECSSRKVTLRLSKLDISDNNLSQIDGALLASLICMNKDSSGEVMNNMITECSSRTATFRLSKLDISDNNLSQIDGALLASLICEILNNMIIECSSRKVTLRLSKLDISDNNLSQIDGALLASLICMNKDSSGKPGLNQLNMHNCNLSGEMMNNMIKEFSSIKTLRLDNLDMSDNNLSQIDGALLASLICMMEGGWLGLLQLNMHNCNLSGEMIIMIESLNRRVVIT